MRHFPEGYANNEGHDLGCGYGFGRGYGNGNGVSRYNYNPISKWKKGDGGFNYPHELIQYWNER